MSTAVANSRLLAAVASVGNFTARLRRFVPSTGQIRPAPDADVSRCRFQPTRRLDFPARTEPSPGESGFSRFLDRWTRLGVISLQPGCNDVLPGQSPPGY